MAKYLPARGWDVHVLTVDRNYLYSEDPTLLRDLPSTVSIHTAKYIEPTLRGLRMAFGGQDRSFKAEKAQIASSQTHAAPQEASARTESPLRRAYRFLRGKLNSPDPFWTWKGPALKKALELIERHGIELVFTSSPPYTTLEIGRELQERLGVRWVADFRDPLTYEGRNHTHDDKVFLRQKRIEREAVMKATAVTTASSAQQMILADQYGVDSVRRTYPILTGLDPALVPAPSAAGEPFLIFVGEFLEQYGDEFFRIFAKVLQDPQVKSKGVRLKIVGSRILNEKRIRPLLYRLGLNEEVEFVDHLPQQKVYELIQTSLACVLCTSRVYPWWTSFAKVVDYIALKKPVVAVIPNPSEARKWLQLTGLGVFLDGDLDACANRLRDFLLRPPSAEAVEEYRRRFLVDFQVDEFERVFLRE